MTIRPVKESVHGWNGWRLSAGEISVGLAPEIGGRISSLTHRGEELFFVQEAHRGETFDLKSVADLRAKKKELGFRLWGGDKTWVAPQGAWWEAIPPLDLDAAPYAVEEIDGGLAMTSPVCRETGLRIVRRVQLQADGEIVLDQELVNEGNETAERGIWDVTQCLRPFDVWLAAKDVRPYPAEGDSVRLADELLERRGDWVRIPCRAPAHFKFGGVVQRGTVVALREQNGETLSFVRSFDTDPAARYLHDASVEVYNSPDYDYLEIEVHAPFVPLAPGARASQRQSWRLERRNGSVSPDDVASSR